MALPLIMSALAVGTGGFGIVAGQRDDCPDDCQDLPQKPQGCQQQGHAAQGLHLRQAYAPGVPQIHPTPPPQIRLYTLQPQDTTSHSTPSKPIRLDGGCPEETPCLVGSCVDDNKLSRPGIALAYLSAKPVTRHTEAASGVGKNAYYQ